MLITANFHLSEFACKSGEPYPEAWIKDRLTPLCNALEVLRAALGTPIHIISGYRTPEHNKKIGGAEHSQHVEGRAVDIMTKKYSAFKINAMLEALIAEKHIQDGGLGLYTNWIHFDLRPTGHARWNGMTLK